VKKEGGKDRIAPCNGGSTRGDAEKTGTWGVGREKYLGKKKKEKIIEGRTLVWEKNMGAELTEGK